MNQINHFIMSNLHWILILGLLTSFSKNSEKAAKKYYYFVSFAILILFFLRRF